MKDNIIWPIIRDGEGEKRTNQTSQKSPYWMRMLIIDRTVPATGKTLQENTLYECNMINTVYICIANKSFCSLMYDASIAQSYCLHLTFELSLAVRWLLDPK